MVYIKFKEGRFFILYAGFDIIKIANFIATILPSHVSAKLGNFSYLCGEIALC
jgi:hypothetical protein